ncbi:MAG: ChbG/HpnK family deacetylase [Steroidobacteraceae bacterium]
MAIPLLICADDFGYSDAVDAGIAELVDAGRVTATSCLTASPRWSTATSAARQLDGRADLGLHFDLTEFDRLASLPKLLVGGRLGLLDPDVIRGKLRAQLDRFEEALGRGPDYVDGHQHVQQLPAVADALIEELEARYPAKRPWVRVSLPQDTSFKSRVIAAMGARRLADRLEEAGFRHTTRLLGIYDFSAEPPYARRLAAWLPDARVGDALMVHPARGVTTGDPLGAAREREFETLASTETGELLERLRLVPSRGDALIVKRPA